MKFFVDDLLYKDECFKIIGICMKIHSILGKGFYEVVYKDALEIELQKIKFLTTGKNNLRLNMKELN